MEPINYPKRFLAEWERWGRMLKEEKFPADTEIFKPLAYGFYLSGQRGAVERMMGALTEITIDEKA